MERRRRVIIVVALALLLPIIAVGGGFLALSGLYNSSIAKISEHEVFPAGPRPAPSTNGSMNILVVGSDTRGDLGGILKPGAAGQRSDTTMVVNISGDRKHISVVSFMRDNWVTIPGHGEAKLNAALSWGGMPLLVQTMESIVKVRIDHVAVTNFAGFGKMTETLGGVDVESPIAFASQNQPGYTYTQGVNHISGDQALAFVRERYAFASGDFQRVKNQQAVVKAMIATLLKHKSNLPSLIGFAQATAPYVQVDSSLDLNTLLGLAPQLASVTAADIQMATSPTLGTGTSSDGQSIVRPDPAGLEKLGAAFGSDSVSEYIATHTG